MKTKLRGVNGVNSYHLRDNYFILVLYCRSFVSFVQWLFRRVYIAIQKYWLAFSLARFLHMVCFYSHKNHRFQKQFSQLMCARSAEKLNFQINRCFQMPFMGFKAFIRSLSYYP